MISIDDFLPRPKKSQSSKESIALTTILTSGKPSDSQVVVAETRKVAVLRPQGAELARPSKEVVEATRNKTQASLDAILEQKTGGKSKVHHEPSLVKYTPAAAGSHKAPTERTLRIVDVKYDPFEPARHKHVKAPARPPSPPAPILKAAPPKLTAEEQREWYIPPSVSGWKNNKGFVIDVEKRVAADGRSQEPRVQAGERMAKLAETLHEAETSARQELIERQAAAEAEAAQAETTKELRLKLMAQRARKRGLPSDAEERAKSRAQRLKTATRDAKRDISETVALGGRPVLSGDAQFDSRLFGRDKATKELYDAPLFAAQQAVREIYKPTPDNEAGPVEFERIEDKYD